MCAVDGVAMMQALQRKARGYDPRAISSDDLSKVVAGAAWTASKWPPSRCDKQLDARNVVEHTRSD
jgi:hypothetical protein